MTWLDDLRSSSVIVIDLKTEKLVPLTGVPSILPSARPGTKLGRATIARWVKSGRLETVKVGGTRYTSMEALARFSEPSTPVGVFPLPHPHSDAESTLDHKVAEVLARLTPSARRPV